MIILNHSNDKTELLFQDNLWIVKNDFKLKLDSIEAVLTLIPIDSIKGVVCKTFDIDFTFSISATIEFQRKHIFSLMVAYSGYSGYSGSDTIYSDKYLKIIGNIFTELTIYENYYTSIGKFKDKYRYNLLM